MSLDELKKIIQDSGIVGCGGAGFPTHLKLDARAETVILNCAECEPLLKVHQQVLSRFTREILSALGRLSVVLDADIVVAVKKTYGSAISAVKAILDEFPRTRLALLDASYPAGDEIMLIYEALGITVPPGTLPIESGCIVLNVETVYNIYNALEHGLPVTQKWLTIAGEVAQPVTALVPVGTPIGEAVKRAGGITTNDPAFLTGGPMMGRIADESDTVKKNTNAIIVLPRDHILVRRAGDSHSADLNRVASACCQCRTCTEMCPRHLLGYPVEPNKVMRALSSRDSASKAFHGIMYCSLCGVCEMIACPQSLSPRSLMKTFKGALQKAGVKPEKCGHSPVSPMLEYRKVDVNRLKIRLGLAKYDLNTPMAD